MLYPPPRKVPANGANLRVKTTPKEASTSQIISLWERVDSQFFDSQSSPTKSSFPKRKAARFVNSSCYPVPTPTRVLKSIMITTPIDHVPKFMKPFIEKIVDVKGDVNCGFWAIA